MSLRPVPAATSLGRTRCMVGLFKLQDLLCPFLGHWEGPGPEREQGRQPTQLSHQLGPGEAREPGGRDMWQPFSQGPRGSSLILLHQVA